MPIGSHMGSIGVVEHCYIATAPAYWQYLACCQEWRIGNNHYYSC